MKERTSKIFSKIISDQGPVSIHGLANDYKVTERTIRNDLNLINDLLTSKKLPKLNILANGQVNWAAEKREAIKNIGQISLYTYRLSPEERKLMTAFRLYTADGYLTINELSKILSVSRNTLLNDLPKVKKYIASHRLEVHSKPKGLIVLGQENDRRLALMEIMTPTVFLFDDEGTYNPFQDFLLDIVNPEGEKPFCEKVLKEAELKFNLHLTDASYDQAVRYLLLSVNRMSSQNYITDLVNAPSNLYPAAQFVMSIIAEKFKLEVSKDETQFLAEVLSGLTYLYQSQQRLTNILKIQLCAFMFINKVSEDLGLELSDDFEFHDSLVNHLFSTLDRPKNDIPGQVIRNILDQNYPEIVSLTEKNKAIIEKYAKRSLTENELSFISLHICAVIERKNLKSAPIRFLVVCTGGLATARLLTERLKRNYNCDIKAIVSAHNLDPKKCQEVDLIISTVPLTDCPFEYLVVDPYLDDSSQFKLNKKLKALGYDNQPGYVQSNQTRALMPLIEPIISKLAIDDEAKDQLTGEIRKILISFFGERELATSRSEAPSLAELLPPTHIELDVVCADFIEAIKRSADILLAEGYITPDYITAMIKNLQENGPYFVLAPGLAIPHAGLDCGSKKLGMTLIRLKNPVNSGHSENDPIKLLFGLSAEDRKSHLPAFLNLIALSRSADFRKQLSEARSPIEVSDIIKKAELLVMN
ncbi:MAG: BglG family transcription antiterminator [Deltaproteobacteria bacterium]|jgi:transcriptional antiterminator/mannitol/fructose-specific phosphotransferase system IIA component (Ntr-type)|nr:BglG family transcription antiterminator [Deltaproteobacteria bacterium]